MTSILYTSFKKGSLDLTTGIANDSRNSRHMLVELLPSVHNSSKVVRRAIVFDRSFIPSIGDSVNEFRVVQVKDVFEAYILDLERLL